MPVTWDVIHAVLSYHIYIHYDVVEKWFCLKSEDKSENW